MITVLSKPLYTAIKAVKVTEISPLPVLNHCLLRTFNGNLTVTTASLTNGGIKAIKKIVPCRVDQDFETCVLMVHRPPKQFIKGRGWVKYPKFYPFLDYLKVIAECEDVLTLSLNPDIQILTIKAGRSVTEFKCLDAQEFPAVH